MPDWRLICRLQTNVYTRLQPAGQVIGIVAALRSWKGYAYLLEAFIKIAGTHPTVHLLIAGNGPYREPLLERINSSGMTDRIHRILQREDVPDVLGAMGVIALPSYGNEGVPQSMAMELPVVSTTVGAIDEAVEDGVTGYLVEPKNVGQLKARLVELLASEELRRTMGAAARKRAVSRYLQDAMLDAMENLSSHLVRS